MLVATTHMSSRQSRAADSLKVVTVDSQLRVAADNHRLAFAAEAVMSRRVDCIAAAVAKQSEIWWIPGTPIGCKQQIADKLAVSY